MKPGFSLPETYGSRLWQKADYAVGYWLWSVGVPNLPDIGYGVWVSRTFHGVWVSRTFLFHGVWVSRTFLVRLKKYFYVLRPLLAARWVAQTGGAAPIEFEKLLTLLNGEPTVLGEVQKLLELKRNTSELGLAPAVPLLNAFIETELEGPPVDVPMKSHAPEVVGQLNELFHKALLEQADNTSLQASRP